MPTQEHQFLAKKYHSRFLHSLKPLVFEFKSIFGRFVYPKLLNPKENLIHIGCANNILKNFDNIDFYNFKLFDRSSIGHDLRYPLPYRDACFDGALTEHTLEHLYPIDAINLLREIRRILRKDSVLRIIVPNLKMYVNFYNGDRSNDDFNKFDSGCEAIWSLTQNWGHISCWDPEMLIKHLIEAGFTSAKEVSFLRGADERLLQDLPSRKWESLYIEAVA